MNRFEEAEGLHQRAGSLVMQRRFSEAEPVLRKACTLAMAETLRLGEMPSQATEDMVEHYERLLATMGFDKYQSRERFKQLMSDAQFSSRA